MASTTGFMHMVFFWLREGDGAAEAEQLAEGARRILCGIPGVKRTQVGHPAGTARSVVDNSYGVALIIEFATAADHDVYQDHPDHHRFIAECSSRWSRVVVYDALV